MHGNMLQIILEKNRKWYSKKYWQYDNDMITYRMLSQESKSDSKGFENKKSKQKIKKVLDKLMRAW